MIVDDSQNYHPLLSTIKRVVKRLKETRDSCQRRKQNFAGMNFSRRKKAAACFVFLQLLEKVTEN